MRLAATLFCENTRERKRINYSEVVDSPNESRERPPRSHALMFVGFKYNKWRHLQLFPNKPVKNTLVFIL